jgi:L-amino acid N-acyltransferase YncA
MKRFMQIGGEKVSVKEIVHGVNNRKILLFDNWKGYTSRIANDSDRVIITDIFNFWARRNHVCFNETASYGFYDGLVRDYEIIVVIEYEGKTIAFTAYRRYDFFLDVKIDTIAEYMAFISPEYINKGVIGKIGTELVMESMRLNGVTSVVVNSSSLNKDSLIIFPLLGFKQIFTIKKVGVVSDRYFQFFGVSKNLEYDQIWWQYEL